MKFLFHLNYYKNNQTHVSIHRCSMVIISWTMNERNEERWSRWGLNLFHFDFFPFASCLLWFNPCVTCNNLVKTFWHIKYSPHVSNVWVCLHHHRSHLDDVARKKAKITTSIHFEFGDLWKKLLRFFNWIHVNVIYYIASDIRKQMVFLSSKFRRKKDLIQDEKNSRWRESDKFLIE